MFTRLAVLSSLVALIVGIWFTMPSLHSTTNPVQQFSEFGSPNPQLAAYQKKTRKHTYDRGAYRGIKSSSSDASEISTQDTLTDSEQEITNTPKPSTLQVNDAPTVETKPLLNETSLLAESNIKTNSETEINEDDRFIKVAYVPDAIINASNINPLIQVKSLSFPDPGSIVGFQTSNIQNGATNVSVTPVLYLTFSVVPSQEIISKLAFYPAVPFSTSFSGNTLVVTPNDKLERATRYRFGFPLIWPCRMDLSQECQNGVNWQYHVSFMTDYKETFVYGKSVQGRDLVGKSYGYCTNQPTCKRILLTGGLHGSEWRSGDLTQLQSYIEQNPQEIINKNKIITIIPFTNPDGTALNIRYNANNVNLNRNFPAYFVGCNICGPAPLSEPESRALADLTLQLKPNVLISYHAQWPPNGIIFRGDDFNSDTVSFAQWVSQRTGYPIGVFPNEPTVPGDQTVWAESQGIRSLIIEATAIANSDWSKNFNLYLALLRDY